MKRLSLLTAVFVGLSLSAAETPPPLEVIDKPDMINAGADLRVRQEIMHNVPGLPGGGVLSTPAANASKNHVRYRIRPWVDVRFNEHLRVYSRLVDEFRWNVNPSHTRAYSFPDELVLDNLYLDAVGIFGGFMDFRIGRQDLWEPGTGNLFGLPHVFIDGTPGDGSRSVFADMARTTLHVTDESALSLFVLASLDRNRIRWGTERARNRALNAIDATADPEMDEFGTGFIFDSNLFGADVLPYKFFTVHKRTASFHDRNGGKHPLQDRTTFGLKLLPPITSELSADLEGMAQVGEQHGENGGACAAWSGYAGLVYRKHISDYVNPFGKLGFHYMSGDKNAADEDGGRNAWDPIWGRGVNDSELFLYGTHYGVAWWSNMAYTKLTLGNSFGPHHTLTGSCGPMFAAEQDGLGHADRNAAGDFKGFLSQIRYDFPLRLAPKGARGFDRFELFGHVLAELFNPGDYYDTSRPSYFLRWQVDVRF